MPEFTSDQLEAIDFRRQDACVVAGPGSGKTTVLVERYCSLIEKHGFEPWNILAITFTEKAAANMKAKLAELFAHDELRLRELESAYVSTIHGFCARVLRENAIAAGIDPRFSVLDAREAEDLQNSCLHHALDELVEMRRAEALQLIAALQNPHVASDLRNAWDAIRSAGARIVDVRRIASPGSGMTPHATATELRSLVANFPKQMTPARQTQRAELLEWARRLEETDASDLPGFSRLISEFPRNRTRVPEINPFKDELRHLLAAKVDCHHAALRTLIFDVFERFEALYAQRKTAVGSLDFNDLERRAIDLLQGDVSVRDRVKKQFRQVMLDEFQDINEQQAQLIELVRGEDVFFAVGDINQSIYGFRHAQPEIFRRYRKQIEEARKHTTHLVHNFRSRAAILRCVETFLNRAEGIEARDLIAGSSFTPRTEPMIEVLRIHDADKDEAPAKEAR